MNVQDLRARIARMPRPALRRPSLLQLAPVLAFVVGFVLFVVLTFPYETVARRLEAEAQQEGIELRIGTLGHGGLLGVRAEDVHLRPPPSAPGGAAPELRFDQVDLSPGLLSLFSRHTSLSFAARAYGGELHGALSIGNDPKTPGLTAFELQATDLDLKALPLQEWSGVAGAGRLSVRADLPSLQPAESAAGSVMISLKGGAVTGGAVMGFPLPALALGELDASARVDKGVARIEKAGTRGGDLEAEADGNVRLRPLLALSQADLHVKFKPTDRWLDANPTIRGAMGLLQNAKQPDGSFQFSFAGPLSNLSSRPGR